MKKIKIMDCILKDTLVDHYHIKDKLLELICNDLHLEKIEGFTKRFMVSKTDYGLLTDKNRPWVNKFLPNYKITVGKMLSSIAYSGYIPTYMWYHQYEKGNKYGWHFHDTQYSGVYYLEFPKGCSYTEFCSPYDLKAQKIEAEEGDVVIFPSHCIHRGPPNTGDRKTIISYNFRVDASHIDNVLVHWVNDGRPNIAF